MNEPKMAKRIGEGIGYSLMAAVGVVLVGAVAGLGWRRLQWVW